MSKEKKDIQQSDDWIFRIFEFITKIIAGLQIVASPLLIGLITGAIIYFSNPSSTRLFFSIIVAALGLVIGIIWATKQWKNGGTVEFMSKVTATPELDNSNVERSPKTLSNEDQIRN